MSQTRLTAFTSELTLLRSIDRRAATRVSGDVNDLLKVSGKRKTFISTLQYLNDFWTPDVDIVIYVGAAPGNGVPLLSRMFPSIIFHLYDTAEFRLQESERIIVHKKEFGLDDINEFKDHKVMFISDYRQSTHDVTRIDIATAERIVSQDMQLQREWVMNLRPISACLKFRPPWPLNESVPRYFKYLSGWAYKQAFGSSGSSETRLIIVRQQDGQFKQQDWDIVKYDLQMSYHNSVVRVKHQYYNLLPSDKKEDPAGAGDPPHSRKYDQKDAALASLGFDSSLEVYTLIRYFTKFGLPIEPTRVNNLRTMITQYLGETSALESGLKVVDISSRVGTKASHVDRLTNLFERIKKELSRKTVTKILDATAHIGHESMLLSRVFPEAQITAIEVDLKTYQVLKENSNTNPDLKNVIPINADSSEYLTKPPLPKFNIIVIDPLFDTLRDGELYLGKFKLTEIAAHILDNSQTDVLLLHVPMNYIAIKDGSVVGGVEVTGKDFYKVGYDFQIIILRVWRRGKSKVDVSAQRTKTTEGKRREQKQPGKRPERDPTK